MGRNAECIGDVRLEDFNETQLLILESHVEDVVTKSLDLNKGEKFSFIIEGREIICLFAFSEEAFRIPAGALWKHALLILLNEGVFRVGVFNINKELLVCAGANTYKLSEKGRYYVRWFVVESVNKKRGSNAVIIASLKKMRSEIDDMIAKLT